MDMSSMSCLKPQTGPARRSAAQLHAARVRVAAGGGNRPSFTLVELLVAIAIIGILMGMVVYTLAGAQRDSLVAKTQGTLKKINEIVLHRWEEYRYRGANTQLGDPGLMQPLTQGQFAGQLPLSSKESARLRLMVLRDTMRMELPDKLVDLSYTPTVYKAATKTNNGGWETQLPRRLATATYNNLRRKFGYAPLTVVATPSPIGVDVASGPFDSAKLLYQIVANTYYNGSSALEFFRPTEIGEVDGAPVFIDGWGTPICFIRWPAGYGEGMVDPNNPQPFPHPRASSDAILNDRDVPDALDPLHTDPRYATAGQKPWLLVPLVVSAGPDREFNLLFDSGVNYALTVMTHPQVPGAIAGPYYFPDPYALGPNQRRQGALIDLNSDAAKDNITNYSLLLEE
jgi:prepilin-type N-terminal cleavage/methylation domain-containing protein